MRLIISILIGLTAITGILPARSASGAVTLSSMFTNHMVLQRDMADPVWGWAKPGQTIKVHFAGLTAQAIADAQGDWMAKLPPLKTDATARAMTISSGSQHIVLHDVLVGEVWLCTGQSNMQYPMRGWFHRTNMAAALKAANHPHIRLYRVPMIESNFSGTPRKQAPAKWQRCTPKTLAGFTAVGYFFGLNLHKKLGVPIGLIESDWGGTNIEAWIPSQGYFAVPQLTTDQNWLRKMAARQKQIDLRYRNAIASWRMAAKKARAMGKQIPPQMPKREDAVSSPHAFNYRLQFPDPHQNPTTLFNGMINPLIPYAIRGAIWYQGENNVFSHDHLYYYHLKALIGGWRALWHEGNFPFYIVQIAPYNYPRDTSTEQMIWHAEIMAAHRIPDCGIASTIDIGDLHNLHPPDKQDVGHRLALIALAKQYGYKNIIYSGPQFKFADFSGNFVVIHFRHIGGGLLSRNGKPLNCFALAGTNGKFMPAHATIVGATIVLTAKGIMQPVAVRFAWRDTSVPNLMNKAGLPALPFTAEEKR